MPSTQDQYISSGYYLTGTQRIIGDPNLIASNIISGVTIFGVQGARVVQGGIQTSDATAQTSDILQDKTAYARGAKLIGTIPTVSATLSQNIVTIPQGYIAGSSSIAVGTVKGASTYTPTAASQVISQGQYLTGPQVIEGDINLTGSNIRSGVTIFGVSGTMVTSVGTQVTLGYIVNGQFQPLSFSGTTAYDAGNTSAFTYYNWNLPVSSASVVSSGKHIKNTSQTVSAWQIYQATTIQDGSLIVSAGGSVIDTMISSFGKLTLSGGKADNTTITSTGSMMVVSGEANNITMSYGQLRLVGGKASNIVTSPYGTIYISSGGSARNVILDAGQLYLVEGTVDSVTVNPGCWLTAGTATSVLNIKQNGGYVGLGSNVYATFVPNSFTDVTVSSDRQATVHSGTIANGVVVRFGGSMYVYSSGIASNIIVEGFGRLTIYSAGFVSNVVVSSDGYLINSGGTAQAVTSMSGAHISNYFDGTITYVSNN